MAIHFKGELSDGHVHMTAYEIIEHNVREQYQRENAILMKLANNPAIDKEIRGVVWKAIQRSDSLLWWREHYCNLREKYDRLVKGER